MVLLNNKSFEEKSLSQMKSNYLTSHLVFSAENILYQDDL